MLRIKINFHLKLIILGVSLALIGWIFVSPSVVLGPFFHKVNLSVDKWPISASNITEYQLDKNTETRKVWSKLPIPLTTRIWLFNVTNAEEVEQGKKPILQEVGPWVYDKWLEKVGLVDRPRDDTIDYLRKDTYIFNASKSAQFTGNEELILPHTLMISMAMKGLREAPSALSIIDKAIQGIFKNPKSIFVRVRAKDILFGGLPIDCHSPKDFSSKLVCQAIKAQTDNLQVEGENRYRFSYLGARNATPQPPRIRVKRGVKDMMEIGTVVEINSKKTIDKWNDTYCDTLRGTDGTIFHPFLFEDEDIAFYIPEFCRSLKATFLEKVEHSGIKTNRYSAILGDSPTNPKHKCYCEAPDKCLKGGVSDLSKCHGIPLIASHPHFLKADKSFLQMVDGLHPSEKNHSIHLDIEPWFAKPLRARRSLQLNIFIHPTEKIKLLANISDVLLPLIWIEETIVLPEAIVVRIKRALIVVHCVLFLKWIIILAGIVLSSISLYLFWRPRQKRQKFDVNNINITCAYQADPTREASTEHE